MPNRDRSLKKYREGYARTFLITQMLRLLTRASRKCVFGPSTFASNASTSSR
jgi:hypothetical protein